MGIDKTSTAMPPMGGKTEGSSRVPMKASAPSSSQVGSGRSGVGSNATSGNLPAMGSGGKVQGGGSVPRKVR